MSMVWETSRAPGGMECIESTVWGVDWSEFMNIYLTLAFQLRRHEEDGLPKTPEVKHDLRTGMRIGIMSLCDYAPDHKLHGIDVVYMRIAAPFASCC